MATGKGKGSGRKRGDGEGSIRQRADGMWRGEIMLGYLADGRADRRYVYAKTQKACIEKLDALKVQAANGMLGDADRTRETVETFLRRWVQAARTSVKPKTYKRYEELVSLHLIPGLGRYRLAKLGPDHVSKFYADKQESHLSPRTVHHLHRVLHRALEMAVKWGYVPRNVCDAVDAPRVPKREMRPPTPEEIGALLDAAETHEDRLRVLWALAVYSGCRLGELLALQLKDVDWAAGRISIRRTLVRVAGGVPTYGEPKTAKSRRSIKLPAAAMATLRAHRDRQTWERQAFGEAYADEDLVFATVFGTPLHAFYVSRKFKRALERAGLRDGVRFHDLRHASATAMLAAGVHPKAASERLGHSTIAITMDLYSHALQELDDAAAEKLGDVFGPHRKAV
jgi:integrase